MAENPKKPNASLELKIQIPRHWREALDLIAERGFEHRSANDVALSFIAVGIKASLEASKQALELIHDLDKRGASNRFNNERADIGEVDST